MLVIVAPGQGAQSSGFLRPWAELPRVAERLTWWSAVTGLDLVGYGTTASDEEIKDTAVAQPLLVAAGLAVADALFDGLSECWRRMDATAGHSVGELVAATLAGCLSPESALVLTRERGAAMAKAAAVTETGMTAVLGGDRDAVLASLERHGLTPANDNGAGQIVAAGTMRQLGALAQDKPEGARLRSLAVAGAFHTRHMASAVGRLRELAPGVDVDDPRSALLSNRDGTVVGSGAEYLERLITQVSSPVRWRDCLETLAGAGVTAMIELPPAGTLTNIAKRAMPGVELLPVKTPDDLDAARKLVTAHAGRQAPA